ncbi:glycosyltransferase [bacterium]|nr:MAG: glycosyltransferase [bacterium]
MDKTVSVITTKIPHHSRHSGYELLINYLHNVEIKHVDRGHASNSLSLAVERILRRFTASKWYQWDGVLGDLFAVKKMQRPDSIVHFLYGDSTIGLIPYIHEYLPGKLVLSIHATPKDLEEVIQFPHMLKNVDAFILLGENQKAFFLNYGISEEKLHVIPHGVDLDFFKPIEFKPIQNELQVLLVGNWRRNFSLYQKVIKNSEELHVTFHVVTQEFNHHYFRGLEHVKLYSGISDESLRAMYQFSDVLLMGLTDAVANNVILEAAACGLPILCEKVGAVTDYFDDSEVHYFEPNNAEQVLSQLKMISKDRTLLEPKAEKALKRVAEYEWHHIGKKTEDIYKSL